MNTIKTKVKKVRNSVNQGLKIFFCVDDILNILEISKQKWNEEFNAQYEYVKRQLKHGNVEFHQYYLYPLKCVNREWTKGAEVWKAVYLLTI